MEGRKGKKHRKKITKVISHYLKSRLLFEGLFPNQTMINSGTSDPLLYHLLY